MLPSDRSAQSRSSWDCPGRRSCPGRSRPRRPAQTHCVCGPNRCGRRDRTPRRRRRQPRRLPPAWRPNSAAGAPLTPLNGRSAPIGTVASTAMVRKPTASARAAEAHSATQAVNPIAALGVVLRACAVEQVNDLPNAGARAPSQHMVRRRQILRRDAERFVKRHVERRAAARLRAIRHLADLAQDMFRRDGAGSQRRANIRRPHCTVESRQSTKNRDFTTAGVSISAAAAMLEPTTFRCTPGRQPIALQNRFARLGRGADDVGARHRFAHRGRSSRSTIRCLAPSRLGEPSRLVRDRAPIRECAAAAARVSIASRWLRACSPAPKHRQVAGVRPRQQPRGQAAGGGGANRGDFRRIEQRHRAAVLGLEQQHQAQMRRILRRLVARNQAHAA